MLLITTFVEIRVVAGRKRKQAGQSHAAYERSMLIHTCPFRAHAALYLAFRSHFQNGMVVAWHV
jgi:hypothetical protein